MILFYRKSDTSKVFAIQADHTLSSEEDKRISWLLDGASNIKQQAVSGNFRGPRKEMITPWSTNAVEITQNMGLIGIERIEEYILIESPENDPGFDPMLHRHYSGLDQMIFTTDITPAPVEHIADIHEYNEREGLALNPDEEQYLSDLAKRLGRPLTDSEVFGFSQVNSEHCRHKIFNGTFIIDGEEKPSSLFKLIKKTSQQNPGRLVSAYKDNVAFVEGPKAMQFAPVNPDRPDFFETKDIETVISLKAETHNFPTTVEPFNGAATGTGGEIRDRLGGGKASLPIAGTAVYMTSYPRLDGEKPWERIMDPRKWLYQTPAEILIKASNGASDFGNKFGQPLICGSLLTFEHAEHDRKLAYDKVIMLAGGVGFAAAKDALKGTPEPGEKVLIMGGDNYRIGMGGGAVSSVDTGRYAGAIELNAVQRANPEMQKRVSNVIRALAESDNNPIVSIHDHGAGGHLNALSELVEATGGHIELDSLPIGDKTLSAKEIVGNESQERMGLVVKPEDIPLIERIAERERAPLYIVGETTDDNRFVFERNNGERPIDLAMADMFGNSPKTFMHDSTIERTYEAPTVSNDDIDSILPKVLSLEAVACKDWLTNKVDRSVTGRIARQQCQGEIQLPLSDCGVVALDYTGTTGIATSIGHAPQAALANPAAGSVLAIAESLTNIVSADLARGLSTISLSANWMWPCRNEGEDAALYNAVEACSKFACNLGINIPTGKDSLSMTQKYADGTKVLAPGTVIISAAGEVADVRKTVTPVLADVADSSILYVPFSLSPLALGGSAYAQVQGKIGSDVPVISDPDYFRIVFDTLQKLVADRRILAMHDISAGGLIVTLLEMAFANTNGGIEIDTQAMASLGETDVIKILFAENPAVAMQIANGDQLKSVLKTLEEAGVKSVILGRPVQGRTISVKYGAGQKSYLGNIDNLRDVWFRPSYQLDSLQSGEKCALDRFENYSKQPIIYNIPETWNGTLTSRGISHTRGNRSGVRAAIIREKGVNGDREMAYALHLAGFDVKDVHMTDLTSGRETLDDINMIVFCGGFSNSDVLGSAKGWAGGFLWNETAQRTLRRFYDRTDTISLGICNGCQLMIELGLITPDANPRPRMDHNTSHKFESQFLGLEIPENNSVMLKSLSGMKLGVWVAHGEGKFCLPDETTGYNVVARYNYDAYPANPNGSTGAVAAIASADGRHLAMMPHPERAIFPWQCGYWPADKADSELTPWIDAFIAARRWVEDITKA